MAGTNVYGELIRAQLQNAAADLSGPVSGLMYFNTVSFVAKWYTGSAWKIAVDTDSAQDLTNKALISTLSWFKHATGTNRLGKFDLSGATDSTSATLLFAQTANRTYTFPDVSMTLLGADNSATVQNKTLDTTNTVTLFDSLFTLQDNGDATKQFKLQLSGITTGNTRTWTVPDSDGTFLGTTTTQNVQNKTLDVTNTVTLFDSLFTVQDNGDATKQFKLELSGITTGNTRTWTVPDASSTFLGTNTTQVVTLKDIDGGTASNTSRITVPKDTLVNLTALTRKQGTFWYDTTSNKPYYDDGSLLKAIGSGSGGSGRNYLSDNADGSTVGTVGSGNVTDTGNRSTGTVAAWQTTNSANISISSTGTTPLREGTSYLTTGSGNAAAGTTFLESPAFNIDNVDLGKALAISFDVSGSTLGTDWDVCMVRYNSSGTFQEKISIAGTASTGTPATAQIPTGTSTFKGFFVPSNTQTDYYALRFRRLANAVNLRLDSLFVGPQTLAVGAPITDWQVYTATFTNFTVSSQALYWRRVGSDMEIRGEFTISGSSGAEARLNLPTGITVGSTPPSNSQLAGYIDQNNANSTNMARVLAVAGNAYVNFGGFDITTATNPLTLANGTSVFNNVRTSIHAKFPVAQWSSSVAMADREVEEYASNTSTTDADDTTSFGTGGSQFGSFTTTRTKRVRFKSPIQSTDVIIWECTQDGGVTWLPLGSQGLVQQQTQANSVRYGVEVASPTNSTDVNVNFFQYRFNTASTFGGAGQTWAGIAASSTFLWRLRKVSSGAVVGFPLSYANFVGPEASNVRAATAATVTIYATDISEQTLQPSASHDVILDSGMKKGMKFRIHNVTTRARSTMAILTFKSSSGLVLNLGNSCNATGIIGYGSIEVQALQDTPTAPSHWKILSLTEEGNYSSLGFSNLSNTDGINTGTDTAFTGLTYTRTMNMVSVAGVIDIDSSGGGGGIVSSFTMSTPTQAALTSARQCGGTLVAIGNLSGGSANDHGSVYGQTGSLDKVTVKVASQTGANTDYGINFQYWIQT